MDNRSFDVQEEVPPTNQNGSQREKNMLNGNGTIPQYDNIKDKNKGNVNNEDLTEDIDETDYMCGAFNKYPQWLQIFADPKCFLIFFCLQNVVAGAEFTFLLGSTTSIEKHFQFSSGDIGLLVMVSEIVPIIFSVVLSFAGGRSNRPRWLAIGQLTGAVGVFLTFCTFLLHPPPVLSESGQLADSKKFCNVQKYINFQLLNGNSSAQSSTSELDSYTTEESSDSSCGGYHSQNLVFFVWLLGYIFKAISGTMVYTVGAPYMDDSISKNSSPIYFAISLCVRVLGPTIGFSLAAIALNTYVYPGQSYGIKPNDPRWVGAWWIGPLIFTFLIFLTSVLILLFPRKMRPPKSKTDVEKSSENSVDDKHALAEELVRTSVVPRDELETHPTQKNTEPVFDMGRHILDDEDTSKTTSNGHDRNGKMNVGNGHSIPETSDGHSAETKKKEKNKIQIHADLLMNKYLSEEKRTSLKEFVKAMKRVMKNKVIVYGALCDFFALIAVFGLFFWLGKYQEHKFRLSKAKATFYSGISGTTSLIVGVILGAIWIHRFRPKAKTVAYLEAWSLLVYLFVLIGMMFITCDFNDDLPGILSPDGNTVELYRGCSSGCECDKKEFIPVCVRDGPISLTYFSPCHAGCPSPPQAESSYTTTEATLNEEEESFDSVTNYVNCTCGSASASVTSGYCQSTCSGFVLYNVILTVVKSFMSIGALGGTLINLRCVDVEDKALSLGVKSTVVSAALIVNPVIYSKLIDSACLVWEETCEGQGSCWIYDTMDFSYKLHGTAAFLFLFAVFFAFKLSANVGDLEIMEKDDSESSSSPLSFLGGGKDAKQPSLRRSLKKLSKLVKRKDQGDNAEGDNMKEIQESEDLDKSAETNDTAKNTNSNSSVSSEINTYPQERNESQSSDTYGKIVPSKMMKITGV